MPDQPNDPIPTQTLRRGWVRLSVPNQRGESVQTQTEFLARMAASKGWSAPMILADVCGHQ